MAICRAHFPILLIILNGNALTVWPKFCERKFEGVKRKGAWILRF